ncbi:hypothetical protein GFS31_13020 [Leptolyngbya sp. BL0902]|uniref:DUF262 domain-containing protein n=1 Tax=Leptolyngbya sp. BL0902 TaxID=1115757 RepID=UPI0018E77E94|nr:DUF262 domain-containing protein [Leptolyngbya sp. BL0902]QQE64621.1 hypothetical protein GFS31_13020 [Leptolyngbya sp. BL0902]
MVDIAPDKQNIDSVFSNTVYYIDFYQRDYKWTEEPVTRLLDDIFYKFNQEYELLKDLDPRKEIITAKYPWYYLNTYVTNTVDGKVYIVDGQQRLTTLTLIIIKLYQLAHQNDSMATNWLQAKLVGFSGMECQFWMNHERHRHVLEALKDDHDLNSIDTSSGITAVNMVRNYRTISTYLDQEIIDRNKLETFIFYFLYRLILINLAVEQTDVPMVFEVINDRGVRLRPYEIIKGKLLGQIDKLELDQYDYNSLWEDRVRAINSYREDEIDTFFRYYLKSKYSDTRKDGTRFDGDYHREMFSHTMNTSLKVNHNPVGVKDFLDKEFNYFTGLYLKIIEGTKTEVQAYPHVFLNRLNEMDSQFLLILSSCRRNDSEEDLKICTISYEIDRLFSLLQLQNAYDSNAFATLLYQVSAAVRDKSIDQIRPVFDHFLKEELTRQRSTTVTEPFQYAFFRNTGINLNIRFKRYFFARIEQFLAKETNMNMKHSVEDLVTKRGHVNGFHVEHILSHNDDNLKLFNGDSDLFEQERNRLGGLLLLKGLDNISSSNEPYSEKLKTYANTLYWNETLRADSYKSKLDMQSLKKRYNLELCPYDSFGPDELNARQKLLYEMSAIIWK